MKTKHEESDVFGVPYNLQLLLQEDSKLIAEKLKHFYVKFDNHKKVKQDWHHIKIA